MMKKFINVSLPTSSTAFKRVNVLFDERIVKISADDIHTEEPCEVIDLQGRILLPGGVDAHCHLISTASPAKAVSTATKAALMGGWTTMCEMSYFSPKPIFAYRDMLATKEMLDEAAYVNMPLWVNVDIDDYPYHAEAALELWVKGSVGVSLFSPSPNPAISELSFTEIMDLFMDIYESDTAFAFQGWDHELHQECSFAAQCDAIKKILRRMQENPIHIPRVASFAVIEFINTISKRSDISFSMCVGDLMQVYGEMAGSELTQDLEEQKDILFELLRTNKVYMVSNNAMTPPAAIDQPEVFRGTKPALAQYSYLWMLSELWKKRKVPLATVIKMSSENAAKRLGLYPVKGCLENGSDADMVIYDPNGITHYTDPVAGKVELSGAIDAVYIKGQEVVNKGKVKDRRGGFLARHTNPKRRHNHTTWI